MLSNIWKVVYYKTNGRCDFNMELPKWHERPESSEKKLTQQETLDGKNFMKLADHFITFANNKKRTFSIHTCTRANARPPRRGAPS